MEPRFRQKKTRASTRRRGATRAHGPHKSHARTHPQTAPNSPWLCAVARATRVHRAELNTRGRARQTTNHAGSARANTTSGPAPLLSPPSNRRSLLSGAKRRQWKSQNTPTTETDATCASPASVLHRDSQPRLKSASEHPRTDHLDQQRAAYGPTESAYGPTNPEYRLPPLYSFISELPYFFIIKTQ